MDLSQGRWHAARPSWTPRSCNGLTAPTPNLFINSLKSIPHKRSSQRPSPQHRTSQVDALIDSLRASTPADVFNPWRDRDPTTDLQTNAAAGRVERLRAHLNADAQLVLIGEAAGYQGCKVSGIAFTSERLMIEGRIPRIHLEVPRLSTRDRPWSEPSATTVWGNLHALGVADRAVLWNAYPWHPHRRAEPHSNRTPTRAERLAGLELLRSLLQIHPGARVFAVGRNAEVSLAELGVDSITLRHPSMGGAMEFARQLRSALRA